MPERDGDNPLLHALHKGLGGRPFRSPAEVLPDPEPEPVQLSFYQRWQLTIFLFGFNLVFGLPFQFTGDGPTLRWFLITGGILVVTSLVDYKLTPNRLADLERKRWLASLPRSNGRVLINKDDFERHFPS